MRRIDQKPAWSDYQRANEVMTEPTKPIPDDLRREFDAAAHWTVEQRMRYSFIKTYRPVLDGARFRSFDTMEHYHQWCEANLPSWLGFSRNPSMDAPVKATMTDQPTETPPPPRKGVDPEDIRKALEAQAKKRPPRPPVNEMPAPIPRLYVDKPPNRRRRKL